MLTKIIQWRRSLEAKYNNLSAKKVIEFCTGPVEYGAKICNLFGMRSEKALTLFNQLVGVKVLDDLDSFVRYNMLEEQPAEEKYLNLRESFKNLTEARNCIDKANEQILQLKPIDELATKIDHYEEEFKKISEKKKLTAYWYAKKTVDLCDSSLESINRDKKFFSDKQNALKSEEDELDNRKTQLRVAIENDATGLQITKLQDEIKTLEKQKDERSQKFDSYMQLVEQLGLIKDPESIDFDNNRFTAKSMQETIREQTQNSNTTLIQGEQQLKEKENEIKDIIYTVESLKTHQNNISGRVSEIRDEILSYTHASVDEIPFIGELIKVKDTELAWESSIEKILHNFALRLIVPDVYYDAVNEYVNSHNLIGRIVYHHYKDGASLKEMMFREQDDNSLYNKLDFKSDNGYVDWLEDVIYNEFNYNCVESLEEFALYSEKAVTREGLIKSVKGKHEKDDRAERFKRNNYVLGWDNKEKIAALTAELRRLQDEQKSLADGQRKIREEIEQQKVLLESYNNLYYTFDTYASIDWKSLTQQIQAKNDEVEKLAASNDKLRMLEGQLKVVLQELSTNKDKRDKVNSALAEIRFKERQVQQRRESNYAIISSMESIDCSSFETEHQELATVTLETIDSLVQSYQKTLSDNMDDLSRSRGIAYNKVKISITKFKNPSADILKKYPDWPTDVLKLPDSEHIELIKEYQTFYKHLVEEDLVSFQEKFDSYLHETLTYHVNDFRIFFTNWKKNITDTIGQLNLPLKGIDFDTRPSTYIQLKAIKKVDVEVAEFEQMLLDAVPNFHRLKDIVDGQRIHYEQKIEPLIKRLDDITWRKRVMDVRSWFTYEAQEYYKENDQKCKTYQSMGQLSGGEKAQLTYTILGSAIAYQFGLTKNGCDSSFRFIAIDEAFKAQDETKARYLISLCKQLHLQLLVVTPSDNIHIVEDDISFVHYVERKGDKSVLVNMPIMEFKEARKDYEND